MEHLELDISFLKSSTITNEKARSTFFHTCQKAFKRLSPYSIPSSESGIADLLARIVISIKQLTVRAPYQGHSLTQGRFPKGGPGAL